MPGRWAGSGVGKHNAYSPRQQKVQLSSQTNHFAHLGMINLYNRGSCLEDKEMGVSRRGQHGHGELLGEFCASPV